LHYVRLNIYPFFEVNANVAAMTVIEIKPHRWGWKVFEGPGVEPVFPEKRPAISYAQQRASFRSGEIHVLDSTGNVERTIAFSESGRML
jgi:hypothetical protein